MKSYAHENRTAITQAAYTGSYRHLVTLWEGETVVTSIYTETMQDRDRIVRQWTGG